MNKKLSVRTLFAFLFPVTLICVFGLISENAYKTWFFKKKSELHEDLNRKNLATMARIKSEYKTSLQLEKKFRTATGIFNGRGVRDFSVAFNNAFPMLIKQLPLELSDKMQTWAFVSEKDQFKSLAGPFLSAEKKRAMERVFISLVRLSQKNLFNSSYRSDERFISGVFSEDSVPEYLATERMNRLTPVIYEGHQHYIFWYKTDSSTDGSGGFISLINGREIENDISALKNLSNSIYKSSSGNSIVVFKTPEDISTDNPVIMADDLSGNTSLKAKLEAHSSLFLQKKSETLRKIEIIDEMSVYADSIANDTPYYAIIYERTAFQKPIAFGWFVSGGLSLLWLIFFTVKTIKGKISLGFTFRLLFFMTGMLPVSLLGILGFNLISEMRESEISELISRAYQNIDEINERSSELKLFSGTVLKEIFSSAEIHRNLTSKERKKVEKGFELIKNHMAGHNLVPGYLLVFKPGEEQLFLSNDNKTSSIAKYHLEYYAMSTFSLHNWLSNMVPEFSPMLLTPAQSNLLKAFKGEDNEATRDVFLDSLGRITSFEGSDQNDNLFFSSILTSDSRIAAYTVLNINIFPTLRHMMIDALIKLSRQQNNEYILLSREQVDAGVVWPENNHHYFRSDEGQAVLEFLKNAASSDFQMQLRNSDSVFIYDPCLKLKSLFCGASLSLLQINGNYSLRINLLLILIAFMAGTIYIVSSSISVLMIEPTLRLSEVYKSLSQGSFSQSFSYIYENELGHLAKVTDSMINGLKQRKLLGKFVSRTFDSDVIDSTNISGARELTGTVLFSDIRGFTTISEQYPAETIGTMLNKHLRAMVNIINSNGGHVEQFIGDAIVAFFPGETEISGKKAVKAATVMRRIHNERMNSLSDKEIKFEIGIGLESGSLMAGTVKAGNRSEYVIIGPAREEAEKLEALSRFGIYTRILVGRQLYFFLSSNDVADLCECEGYHELRSTEVKI